MAVDIYFSVSALDNINEGSDVAVANVDGTLLNIKAYANFLVESLKLFASNEKSFELSFITANFSPFLLLVTTQAKKLKAIDEPLCEIEDGASIPRIGLLSRPKTIALYKRTVL